MPDPRQGLRLCALVLFAGALAAQSPDPGTSYRLRILDPVTPQRLQELESGFDVVPNDDGSIDVIVMPDEMDAWKRTGVRTSLVSRGRPYAEIAGQSLLPDSNYYTPAEIVAKIDSLVAAYPTLAQRIDLTALPGAARTHDNQGIYALKVSDNVAKDEDEPAILLAAQHHARELNSPVMVIGAMERILAGYAADPVLKALVDGYELYFVPCVNPDGTAWVWTTDNNWRKNRRPNGGSSYGVDNNRNYPFLWGLCGASTTTTSETYRGPAAGSEPENRTMIALCRALRPEIYLDFHSSGREVLFSYAPCATVDATLRTFLDRYVGSLRTPMSYATRAPSGSGEAPEFHWSDGGTLSFLTEIMTSFQPSHASTLTEEARVWPGIRTALSSWRPALRGHVTSIYKRQPLAATIRYTPNLFSLGEQGASRPRDGRYALWLPLGGWSVTFDAPGHRSVTKVVQVTAYDAPQTLEVEMIPTMPSASLATVGTDRIGTTTQLVYTSPGDVGETYWILLAAGATPGIPVGAGRVVPLNPDVLFWASAVPNTLLVNNVGVFAPGGQATATFPIPNVPAFVGLTVHAGGITQNDDYLNLVKNYSNAVPIKIRP